MLGPRRSSPRVQVYRPHRWRVLRISTLRNLANGYLWAALVSAAPPSRQARRSRCHNAPCTSGTISGRRSTISMDFEPLESGDYLLHILTCCHPQHCRCSVNHHRHRIESTHSQRSRWSMCVASRGQRSPDGAHMEAHSQATQPSRSEERLST